MLTSSPLTTVPQPAAGVLMHVDYAKAVGRLAYIWGWPMVNQMNRRVAITRAPQPGRLNGVLPVAPRGRLAMLNDYILPSETFVTCPNQDVVYGLGFFSLDEEPVVIQVPDFGSRFWVYALYDARTDQFGELGKPYLTKPGFYLLVGPQWKGKAPKGITAVIQSSTSLANAIPRVFMNDTAEDRRAIQPVINQIVAYPLAEFDGRIKTIDWSRAPNIPAPESKNGGETQWVVPDRFFDEFSTVLATVPPLPGEEALYGQFRALMKSADANPAIMQALVETARETEQEVIERFFQWKHNGLPAGNGWNRSTNNAEWGVDYYDRTGTSKSNMFDNRPNETQYFYTDDDSSGEVLDGRDSYEITFPAGAEPPVEGFWSLTLYNDKHLFHPNPLQRFSLGTKNEDLVRNADGSLTLYVGASAPGQGKDSNWLPAPKGRFSLYIRAYWAGQAILDGAWTPPVIQRTGLAETRQGREPLNTPTSPSAPPLIEQLNQGNWLPRQEAEALRNELFYQRAIHAYMCMQPAMNVIGMRDGSEESFGAGYNVLPIWKERMDSRCWVPTPNADVIYSMSYLDLKQAGPLVVAAPPEVIGMFTDFFQRTLTDVGLIGPDRARGGLYLLLPPDYDGVVPQGYFTFRSSTYNVLLFFRTIMAKGSGKPDPAPAVATAEQTRIYPLWAAEKDVKSMVFPNASGKRVNMMYPTDDTYWTKLKEFVDDEPVSAIDAETRGVLASIGIVRGQPFNPTDEQKAAMHKAVTTAPKMILAMRQLGRTDGRSLYYKDRQYENAWCGATSESHQETYLDIDQRAAYYQYAFSSAPAMVMRTLGAGSKYPFTTRDADGEFLNGANTYKLHLPPDPPARLFWAVTAYNITDGTMPETEQLLPSTNGYYDVPKNADGSIDIWFGPKQPEGVADTAFIQTVSGRHFLVALRLYGTGVEFFDQTWKPDDVVKVK